MAIARDMLRDLGHLLRPLHARIARMMARAVVQLVADGAKLQTLQVGALPGEDLDDCERFQEYGFTSVPLPGAEAVVIFPNGDRGHPLVVAVDDRRYRPTGGEPGEVVVYNHAGAVVRLKPDGTVEIGGGGAVGALATKADLDALRAAIQGATPSPNDGGAALKAAILDATWTTGTTKLRGE